MFEAVIKKGDPERSCPYCGKKLKYQNFEEGGFLGTEYFFPLPCECVKQREEETLKELNEQYRERLFRISGMEKKHMEMTFESLTEKDPKQEESISTCKKWAETFYTVEEIKGLVLMGGVGSGKTHLLCAIANSLIKNYKNPDRHNLNERIAHQNPTPMFYFISTVELFSELQRKMHTTDQKARERGDKIIEWCKNARVLFLDDLGAERTSEYREEQLFLIIDHRINKKRPTIISTNKTKEELSAAVGARIFDRIKGNCELVTNNANSHRKPL